MLSRLSFFGFMLASAAFSSLLFLPVREPVAFVPALNSIAEPISVSPAQMAAEIAALRAARGSVVDQTLGTQTLGTASEQHAAEFRQALSKVPELQTVAWEEQLPQASTKQQRIQELRNMAQRLLTLANELENTPTDVAFD